MTVEEAKQRIYEIECAVGIGDDEVAHSEEDRLRHDVLEHIAATMPESSPIGSLARIALSTSDIEFARWCA